MVIMWIINLYIDNDCACWWSGAGLQWTISKHSMEYKFCMLSLTKYIAYELCFYLCYEYGIWSMLCLLVVWCQPAFNNGQTQHGICISYMRSMVMYVVFELCFQWCCVWKRNKTKTVLCLLMVWCQNTFDLVWTQQGTCILLVYWNVALSIGYDQCWVFSWSDP